MVVVPTKELAQQICNEAATLCRDTGLRPHVLGKIKPDKKVTILLSLICFVLLLL